MFRLNLKIYISTKAINIKNYNYRIYYIIIAKKYKNDIKIIYLS